MIAEGLLLAGAGQAGPDAIHDWLCLELLGIDDDVLHLLPSPGIQGMNEAILGLDDTGVGVLKRAVFQHEGRFPVFAIIRQGDLAGVRTVADGQATLRWVKVGRTTDGTVEVLRSPRRAP